MDENSNLLVPAPLNGIIDLLTEKWLILTINEIGNHGKIGYSELQKEIGMAEITLTMLIRKLVKAGIIEKEKSKKDGRKINYSLTKKGIQVRTIITPLIRFAVEDESCKKIVNCDMLHSLKYSQKQK